MKIEDIDAVLLILRHMRRAYDPKEFEAAFGAIDNSHLAGNIIRETLQAFAAGEVPKLPEKYRAFEAVGSSGVAGDIINEVPQAPADGKVPELPEENHAFEAKTNKRVEGSHASLVVTSFASPALLLMVSLVATLIY